MAEAAVRLGTTCAWRGTTLLVTDAAGECGAGDPLSGLFVREVRHLPALRFEINGRRPWLCEWARPGPTELAFVYVYPELVTFGGGGSGLAGDEISRDEDGIPHRATTSVSSTASSCTSCGSGPRWPTGRCSRWRSRPRGCSSRTTPISSRRATGNASRKRPSTSRSRATPSISCMGTSGCPSAPWSAARGRGTCAPTGTDGRPRCICRPAPPRSSR